MGQRLAAVFTCVMTTVVPVLGGAGKASTDSLGIALEYFQHQNPSAIGDFGLISVAAHPDRDRVAIRVRAYADNRVDKAILQGAQQIAENLLASAGLQTVWRLCGTAAPCPLEESSVPEILVLLLSVNRPNGRNACGSTALGAQVSEAAVLVSVPCVEDVALRLTRDLATHPHPLLVMPRYDDVVGAVVAHEIGHVLGIKHARTGLMRARLGPGEIIALRQGRLGFSPQEAARMRVSAWSTRTPDSELRTAR